MIFQSVNRIACTFLTVVVATSAAIGMACAQERKVSYCFNDWPPCATLTDGTPSGITLEILREANQSAGLKPGFVELPSNRCLEMVRRSEIDVVLAATARPEFLQGEVSFCHYTNTVWVRADDPVDRLERTIMEGKVI